MSSETVVIVGAGPVGLLCALGLARRGVQVTVLEREPEVIASPRAAVYHWCVLEVLDALGLREDAEAEGVIVRGNDFRRPSTGEVVSLSQDAIAGLAPFPYNLNLGQDRLGRLAVDHLGRLPNATIRWNTELVAVEQDEHGVTALLDGPGGAQRLRSEWLIGADGAHSIVRKAISPAFDGFTWAERFVATNIRFDFEAHGFNRANMVLDARLGCIVAMLEDEPPLWRVTFSESESLPLDTLPERIDAFMQAFLPGEGAGRRGYELVQHAPYRMHQRTAARYRQGRILLAGDAAHLTNPTGAMGLTTGVFDVELLLDRLSAVIEGRQGTQALDDYSERRRRAFLELASPAASRFKQLVYDGSQADIDAAFEEYRRVASDPSSARDFFLGMQVLREKEFRSVDAEALAAMNPGGQ